MYGSFFLPLFDGVVNTSIVVTMLCSPAHRVYVYRSSLIMKFTHPAIPFVGRLLIVYIFATSGIAKVFGWQANVQYVSTRHLPMVPLFLVLAALIEIGGSICLIIGYRAREAGMVMFLYMIPLTVLFHNYWAASGMLAGAQET